MVPIRTMRPVYVDRLPPCNHACPAGENVQAWLSDAQAGRYREAWTIILRDNPMPAVHGRVCYHPCEDACNRKDVDAAVSIHAVERFLGDMALREGWTIAPDEPQSDHRVLVVGAGPSGLSAAWHLARRGHKVVVYEAGPMAGGMMHFGIPKYRLPREVLDGEIERIRRIGVEIVLNHKVTDLVAEKANGRFDAVFLAVGAHLSQRQDVPARDAVKVYDALQFLKEVETADQMPRIGRRVAIYGGGDTAMDAARPPRGSARSRSSSTAARASRCPLTTSRRTKRLKKASDPLAAHDQGDRWLDDSCRGDAPRREPLPGADRRVRDARSRFRDSGSRTGHRHDVLKNVPGITFKNDGTVVVATDMQTGCPACSRAAIWCRTPDGHHCCRARKEAAQHIDRWLRRETCSTQAEHDVATFEMLRLWYHAEADRRGQSAIDVERSGTPSTKWSAGSIERRLRGATLPVLRQLLRV